MMELSIELLLFLAGAAFLAGFIDAIAGGGGLISVPALMLAGLDPATAIATNKVNGTGAVVSAALTYARKGLLNLNGLWKRLIPAILGAALGANLVALLPLQFLKTYIPILLILMAIFMAFWKPHEISLENRKAALTPIFFGLCAILPIGIYDGAFGPGAGTFFLIALLSLRGLPLLTATAETKALNSGSNFASLMMFAYLGLVQWIPGLVMAVTAMVGAYFGASLAMLKGNALIKPLVLIVTLALALKLLLDPAHPFFRLILSRFTG